MTYRIFQYRLPMDGQPDDLNAWLASHRVVSVTQHLAAAAGSSLLVFVVETTGEPTPKPASGPKIDYKGNASYHHLPGQGLPIGALTSQYLGNFMLDRLDQEMKHAGARRYLRYMDDVIVWGNRDDLARLRHRAHAELTALGLEMKRGGEWNRCADGVPFLGFVVYPDRLRLGREGRKRLRRKFSALEKQRLVGQVNVAEASQRATSLLAHARLSDDVAWRRIVLGFHHFGEAQEPQPRPARRLLEQHRQELPLGVSQQEEARQPQQEQRLPSLRVPRHGDAASPDDAPSRALPPVGRDKSTGKTPPHPDTPRGAWRNGCGGAPLQEFCSHD